MSYCAIEVFRDGKIDDEKEFGNSWGGSARVWSSLWDRYEKKHEYDSWMMDDTRRLWDLDRDPRLQEFEKSVLVLTFDRAIVWRGNFKRMADDLKSFAAEYPVTGKADHLASWAEFIQGLAEDPSNEAIGVIGTSVTGDLFNGWDQETDTPIEYNLHKDTKHIEVYEYLATTMVGG